MRDGALGPATAVPDVPEAEDVPSKKGGKPSFVQRKPNW